LLGAYLKINTLPYEASFYINMVTFEEFFEKKKIDLSLLQQDNEALYAEFENHFAQMGAKSFDHSKKFWFNKLRKDYHLVDKPVVQVVEKVAVVSDLPLYLGVQHQEEVQQTMLYIFSSKR